MKICEALMTNNTLTTLDLGCDYKDRGGNKKKKKKRKEKKRSKIEMKQK